MGHMGNGAQGYRVQGYGAHVGNEVQGMGHRGMEHMGNGVQGYRTQVWGTWVMGYRGMGCRGMGHMHGQWGTGVWYMGNGTGVWST